MFLGWRDGRLIYLNAGVSTAEANWMLDLGKSILMPQPEKIG